MTARVERDFVRFGNKSYALAQINSVDVRQRQPNGSTGALFCGLGTAVSAYWSYDSPEIASKIGWAIASLLLAGLAFFSWRKSQEWEYLLFLTTSAAEQQAYASSDPDEIAKLRDDIEAAIAGLARGSSAARPTGRGYSVERF